MDLITTAQAADRLGVSLRTLHRLRESGDLSYVTKLPAETGSYLFAPEVVEALRAQRATAAEAKSASAAA